MCLLSVIAVWMVWYVDLLISCSVMLASPALLSRCCNFIAIIYHRDSVTSSFDTRLLLLLFVAVATAVIVIVVVTETLGTDQCRPTSPQLELGRNFTMEPERNSNKQ